MTPMGKESVVTGRGSPSPGCSSLQGQMSASELQAGAPLAHPVPIQGT